jgi:hypothetical protein
VAFCGAAFRSLNQLDRKPGARDYGDDDQSDDESLLQGHAGCEGIRLIAGEVSSIPAGLTSR